MKTVQDYLDLGLVFIGGDKCFKNGVSGDEFNRHWHESPAMYSNKIASSFAWRNNDGVKPEYKGLIDVCFEGGTVSHNESAIDFEWSLDDENYIAKWRPIVLQSDDAKKNPYHSFVTSINIDGPKFTIKEETPKTITVNIEGRDHLIASHKPTVSPKEDKPMKPVYTAEMHAKGELPHVGSECEALCMDATNSKHVWTKAEILMHHDGNECAVYCIDAGVLRWADEFKPIAKTIKVNGFDVPAPMSEAPECGSEYFVVDILDEGLFCSMEWEGDGKDNQWLSKGVIHSTESAAIAHAKAMLGIDPNA